MVLFFCTFIALRSQDGHKRVQDIRDYELEAEKELFGGWVQILYNIWLCIDLCCRSLIDDDNFIHALRVYRDRISGAIRLQASVHEGDMRRWAIAEPIKILLLTIFQGHPCGQPL